MVVTTHTFLFLLPLCSTFYDLHPTFLLHTYSSHLMKPCHFVVFLPVSAPILSSISRLPHLTLRTCLLQVVKWILLSQTHQGKSRKRKRIEPKVNYKEVGDPLISYGFYLPCFTFIFWNSWKYPFLFWKLLCFYLSGFSLS